jgi:hypothetical protein
MSPSPLAGTGADKLGIAILLLVCPPMSTPGRPIIADRS